MKATIRMFVDEIVKKTGSSVELTLQVVPRSIGSGGGLGLGDPDLRITIPQDDGVELGDRFDVTIESLR